MSNTPEDTELEILVDNLRYIFALPPDEYNFTKRDEAMNLITLHTQEAYKKGFDRRISSKYEGFYSLVWLIARPWLWKEYRRFK